MANPKVDSKTINDRDLKTASVPRCLDDGCVVVMHLDARKARSSEPAVGRELLAPIARRPAHNPTVPYGHVLPRPRVELYVQIQRAVTRRGLPLLSLPPPALANAHRVGCDVSVAFLRTKQ